MQVLHKIIYDDIIFIELGRMYNELMLEAVLSPDIETKEHGFWLKKQLDLKIEQHSRSYH